jgi:hypothetical protein
VITAPAGESGVYVARALEATGDRAEGRLTARVVPSASLARGLDDASIGLSAFPAAVVLATRGLERRARESLAAFVRAGGGLLIAASPDVDPGVVSSMFDWRPALAATTVDGEGVALSPTDVRHPIFRPFGALTANLGQVRFDRAWRVKADGWDVVASFTDGSPALLERREGKGRVVLFASDLDRRWNDFPQHPAFVPFALEAVRYVGGGRDLGREYVIGAAPAGVGPAPGVYRAPNDNRTVAVNVDPRESATAALSVDDFLKHVDRISVPAAATDTRARQLESRQSYWQYGLLLMIAALVAESFVGRA